MILREEGTGIRLWTAEAAGVGRVSCALPVAASRRSRKGKRYLERLVPAGIL
jgi:hypothetical protein